MGFLRFLQLRGRLRRAWDSERGAAFRFYASYFRWPLALALLALISEKAIFYGVLPLANAATREWHYLETQNDFWAGRDREALEQIRGALLITRDDSALWRLAAQISDQLGSPDTAYCWQQVDRLEPGISETQLALANSALRYDQNDLAAAALREVAPEQQDGLAYLMAAGREARAEGNAERSDYFFAQAEALRPNDASVLFTLAEWHASRHEWRAARSLLEALAKRPPVALEAWRRFVDLDVRQDYLHGAQADEAHLLAQRGADFSDRVRMLDFLPDPSAESANLLRDATAVEAASVLNWMAAHGEAEAALIWIRTRDEAWQDDPDIGLARAACLEALGEWEHLWDDEQDSFWPGRESARLMVLARASLALGKVDDARAAWHGAVAACVRPDDFDSLLRTAAAFPDADEARAEVWLALAQRCPGEQWPLRSLLKYDLERGDLVAAQAAASQLAVLVPDDAATVATRDLLGLLRGTEVPQATADLAELEKRAPGDPAVATAAAYSLYLQGRFGEALALIGGLDPDEMHKPEWAPYVGQLLAAGGPPRQAEAVLEAALAQPRLIESQRRNIERALDLATTRRVLADWLHPANDAARTRDAAFFAEQAASGKAVYLIGASVVESGNLERAASDLARIDPASLDRAEVLLDEGAVLTLAGLPAQAEPWLTLSPDLPVESPAESWHRMVEAWWKIERASPSDAMVIAGLLGAYRGLDAAEADPAFWRQDAEREVALTRAALAAGQDAGGVQLRLEALLQRVPATAEIKAQVGYALFLQGRVEAGRQRMETLSPVELQRPELARYYAAILHAGGEKRVGNFTLLGARIGTLRTP